MTELTSYLTEKQITLLLRSIHAQRVLQRQGMSYVEGYDIRAELNRVFGFCRWSATVAEQELICAEQVETRGGKSAWYVLYRTRIQLAVQAPDGTPLTVYDGTHVGASTHPDRGEAYGNAVTNSETYALRRAAINLGDQFGLSLYNKGSLEPIVRWTLVRPEPVTADTDDVPQVAQENEESPVPQEAAVAVASPKRTRAPKAAPAAPGGTERILALIEGASTVEELTQVYHLAGREGELQTPVGQADGSKATVQELLYRRKDELDPSFRGRAAAGDSAAAAEGDAGQ
jgi:recombination DNA repair RAD52 pathway protein